MATSKFSFQDVLNVFAPNEGVAALEGPVAQLSSTPFSHQGQLLQLGHENLRTQLVASGRGTRTNPAPPVSRLSLAGTQVVTG